jgi:hypothetical protein
MGSMRRRETPKPVRRGAPEGSVGRLPLPPGLYLLDLVDPAIPTRADALALGRARALQAYLRALDAAAPAAAVRYGTLELWVLNERSWSAATSAPYGLPARRSRSTPLGPAHAILAPATTPGRLLERFDPYLLAATGADPSLRGLQRSQLREFLDASVGVEWAHARLRIALWHDGPAWFTELQAETLLLAALTAAHAEIAERYLAWSRVLSIAPPPPPAGRRPARSAQPRLDAFTSPRAKMPFAQFAWCHGAIVAGAAALVAAFGAAAAERLAGGDAAAPWAERLRACALAAPPFAAWCSDHVVATPSIAP